MQHVYPAGSAYHVLRHSQIVPHGPANMCHSLNRRAVLSNQMPSNKSSCSTPTGSRQVAYSQTLGHGAIYRLSRRPCVSCQRGKITSSAQSGPLGHRAVRECAECPSAWAKLKCKQATTSTAWPRPLGRGAVQGMYRMPTQQSPEETNRGAEEVGAWQGSRG
jgi:hypothetical protein